MWYDYQWDNNTQEFKCQILFFLLLRLKYYTYKCRCVLHKLLSLFYRISLNIEKERFVLCINHVLSLNTYNLTGGTLEKIIPEAWTHQINQILRPAFYGMKQYYGCKKKYIFVVMWTNLNRTKSTKSSKISSWFLFVPFNLQDKQEKTTSLCENCLIKRHLEWFFYEIKIKKKY